MPFKHLLKLFLLLLVSCKTNYQEIKTVVRFVSINEVDQSKRITYSYTLNNNLYSKSELVSINQNISLGDSILIIVDMNDHNNSKIKSVLSHTNNANENITPDETIIDNAITLEGIFHENLIEVPPYFPYGEDSLKHYFEDYFTENISFEAVSNGKEIYFSFFIDTDGQVSNFRSISKHSIEYEPQLRNLIRNMPSWIAGENDREKVKKVVFFSFYIY